jgi:hypothetical protein
MYLPPRQTGAAQKTGLARPKRPKDGCPGYSSYKTRPGKDLESGFGSTKTKEALDLFCVLGRLLQPIVALDTALEIKL